MTDKQKADNVSASVVLGKSADPMKKAPKGLCIIRSGNLQLVVEFHELLSQFV